MLTFSDFRPYQVVAYEWLRHRTEGFLWLPLGYGKTIVAASVYHHWRQTFPSLRRVLVLGTTKIIEMTWADEFQKWEHLRPYSYAPATGALSRREQAILSMPDVLGLNYENLRWFLHRYQGTAFMPQTVIYDEISRMKDHGTQRFRALEKVVPRFQRRLGLTATPAAEGYLGLWAQEACISSRRRLGRNITQFRVQHCTERVVTGDRRIWTVTQAGEEAIREKLRPITLSLQASDFGPVYKATEIDVPVGWSVPHRMRYDTLEKKFLVEIEEGKKVKAGSLAIRSNKLRQLCAGCVYLKTEEPKTLDEEKIEALVDAVEALNGAQVIIFYQYTWEKEQLLARLPRVRGLKSRRDKADWDAKEIQCLLLHPDSAGPGLNLHKSGCQNIFWASLPWGLEPYLQANGRIIRPAAGEVQKGIRIYRFLRRDSIDEDMADRRTWKEERQEALIEKMKSRQGARS